MGDQGELILDEHADDLGQQVELLLNPLGYPALPIEPRPEPLVEIAERATL